MGDRMEELKGNVKQGIGSAIGNERLESEGQGQATGARVGRKAKGAAREAGGALQEGIGKLAGDPDTEVQGKADRLRGKADRSG